MCFEVQGDCRRGQEMLLLGRSESVGVSVIRGQMLGLALARRLPEQLLLLASDVD